LVGKIPLPTYSSAPPMNVVVVISFFIIVRRVFFFPATLRRPSSTLKRPLAALISLTELASEELTPPNLFVTLPFPNVF